MSNITGDFRNLNRRAIAEYIEISDRKATKSLLTKDDLKLNKRSLILSLVIFRYSHGSQSDFSIARR